MSWTPARVNVLKLLIKQDLSNEQIALRMGVTKGTISGKRNRMGLTESGKKYLSPSHIGPRQTKQEQRKKSLDKPPIETPKPPPASSQQTQKLSNRGCQFPLWGFYDTGGEFCGKPIAKRSYCEEHFKLCYVPIQRSRSSITNFRP